MIHLDRHYWQPGWVKRTPEEWRALQSALLDQDRWIVDGNYGAGFDLRFSRADTVVVLSLPRLRCLTRVLLRWLRHRGRDIQAKGCPERFDAEFLRWVWRYPIDGRPRLDAALARHLIGYELSSWRRGPRSPPSWPAPGERGATAARRSPRRSCRCLRSGRERRRATFDQATYHRAHPDYPEELFDHLVAVTGLPPGARLLEIGCGTGKVTLPLACRGFRITCVELGTELAVVARQNLSELPDVEVIEGSVETWSPPPGPRFDLVAAATSWHWIDPARRYRKAWDALRPGGHLAFWSATHVFPDDGDPFFGEIQGVYDELGEGLPPGYAWPRPGGLEGRRSEIDDSGHFEVVDDAEGYLALLDTFSGHIAMEAWKRDRLHAEIRARLGPRANPRLRRHWGAALHVARRRS